jgi:hypothetical protein
MLKSDRLFLAKFALDPEMENQFDDMDFYFDDEIEEAQQDSELDYLVDREVEHVFTREDDILSVIDKQEVSKMTAKYG